MKKFKDLVEESPAKDYVGDGESQKDYDAAGSDEQKFKDLHLTHNAHLVQPKGHPVTPDYVFTGERPGGKKGHEGEDHKGSTKVPGETILKTYKDFVASGKSAAGDQAPVMQGSSKVKEEVEYIDEGIQVGKPYRIRKQVGGRDTHVNVKVTNYKKGPGQKDIVYFKDADGKSGQMPAKVFMNRMKEEVEYIDEAFKKGMLKLKDGKTVKIDEKTAKFLNNAMKQLNPGNRKKMEAEAMKNKKSFDAMVDFAKAAA